MKGPRFDTGGLNHYFLFAAFFAAFLAGAFLAPFLTADFFAAFFVAISSSFSHDHLEWPLTHDSEPSDETPPIDVLLYGSLKRWNVIHMDHQVVAFPFSRF